MCNDDDAQCVNGLYRIVMYVVYLCVFIVCSYVCLYTEVNHICMFAQIAQVAWAVRAIN